MEKTKIFYVIGTLGIGGAEKHIISLISNLDKQKYEFSILCLTQSGPLEQDAKAAGAKVIPLGLNCDKGRFHPLSYLNILKTFFKMYLIFLKERPRIVHSYLYTAYIFGVLSAKLARVPIIISSRRSLGIFKNGKPLHQRLENFVNRFTDYVTVNSQAVKEDALRRERNLNPDRIHLIYNGVDVDRFSKRVNVEIERRRMGLPIEAKLIGTVANLIYYKGHKDIINAIPTVLGKVPDAYFLFVGRDGGMLRELEQLAMELGVRDRIIFKGLVEESSEIYSVIDVFVMASHEEGFSNAILEAMASGKPIVATSVGGNPEAVQHDKTGYLIPPRTPEAIAEALIDLFQNPTCKTQFATHAHQAAIDRFPLDNMISQTDTFYATCLRESEAH